MSCNQSRVNNFHQGPVLAVVSLRCLFQSSIWTALRSCWADPLQLCSIRVQLYNHWFNTNFCKLKSIHKSFCMSSYCFKAGLNTFFFFMVTQLWVVETKLVLAIFFFFFGFYWKSMRETTSKLGLCICAINKLTVLCCSADNCKSRRLLN